MGNKIKEKARIWLTSKRYNWRNYDIALVIVVLALSLISSYILSILNVQNHHIGSLKRQIFTVAAGLFIIVLFSLIDYHTICTYVPLLYIVTTILVACTRFSPLGTTLNTDSYRWLDFKVFNLQPSEICKIVVILSLAAFFVYRREKLQTFQTFFLACLIAFLPTGFILVQSDLSSSVVIIVVLGMMLLSSGIGRKIIGPVIAVLVPVSGFLVWYIFQPNQLLLDKYQLRRITGWIRRHRHSARCTSRITRFYPSPQANYMEKDCWKRRRRAGITTRSASSRVISSGRRSVKNLDLSAVWSFWHCCLSLS